MCRHVAAALHPGRYRLGYVSLTTGNVLDMYKSIAWELALPTERSRATAYRAIRTEITRLVCEAKQLPVLVIDEAQHLRNDVLEDSDSCAYADRRVMPRGASARARDTVFPGLNRG